MSRGEEMLVVFYRTPGGCTPRGPHEHGAGRTLSVSIPSPFIKSARIKKIITKLSLEFEMSFNAL
jgi:hypothetical protein